MPFIGRVELAPVDESGERTLWVVVSPFWYRSRRHHLTVRVPDGFRTDLASVPRVPLAWLLAGGVADSAAVVHDWIYHNPVDGKMLPREMCDSLLDEIAEETRVPSWRRKIMYWAVRAFGWTAYGKVK